MLIKKWGNYRAETKEYEKQQAMIKLLSKLSEAENAIKTGEEWKTLDDLKNALEV